MVGGRRGPAVAWGTPFLDGLFREACLRYLAVAHFGRGRGSFRDADEPARWRDAVEGVTGPTAVARAQAWTWARGTESGTPAATEVIEPHVLGALRAALSTLHPRCRRWIDAAA
jgi:hypothetical protein